MPLSQTPAKLHDLTSGGRFVMPSTFFSVSAFRNVSPLRRGVISGLNPFAFAAACVLPVYASRRWLPNVTQDSVLRCWLGIVKELSLQNTDRLVMYSLMREYTRMVASRSIPEVEKQWLKVLGTLNELQARLFVSQKALAEGRGGISRLSRLTGMSRPTIMNGIAELEGKETLPSSDAARIRQRGAGRKLVEETDPGMKRALMRILEETTAGDPMSLLKWTNKSTRAIADELTRSGHSASWVTVARCLHDMEYSLQANVKTIEGKQHPDRDSQFRYINKQVKSFLRTGDPVVSVDTKKKELVGPFENKGRRWRRKGMPEAVYVHDFPSMGVGKAIPYGTYDVARDDALVNVGITHDTAEFAVESIRRWWRMLGRKTYSKVQRLLICADAGGSNGNRLRAWKLHLQSLANQVAVPITVCHYPPGTSKWNKIEHRLFSFISMNWRGQALVSFQAIVNLIGNTRTKTGLKVKAVLDTMKYETGQKVAAQEFDQIHLKRHAFHPDWNYTVIPHKASLRNAQVR